MWCFCIFFSFPLYFYMFLKLTPLLVVFVWQGHAFEKSQLINIVFSVLGWNENFSEVIDCQILHYLGSIICFDMWHRVWINVCCQTLGIKPKLYILDFSNYWLELMYIWVVISSPWRIFLKYCIFFCKTFCSYQTLEIKPTLFIIDFSNFWLELMCIWVVISFTLKKIFRILYFILSKSFYITINIKYYILGFRVSHYTLNNCLIFNLILT